MATVRDECFFYLRSLLWISGISGFSFFAIEHIRKPGIHGKFSWKVFWVTKTVYLISSTVLGILWVRWTSLKYCSKLLMTIYYWTLKVAFLVLKPKWYLDSKLVAFVTVTNEFFLFSKLSVDIRHFRVFVFYHRAYSKTWRPRKIFRSSFFKVLRLFICFWALL